MNKVVYKKYPSKKVIIKRNREAEKRKYETESLKTNQSPKKMKKINQKGRRTNKCLNEFVRYQSDEMVRERKCEQVLRESSKNSVTCMKTFTTRGNMLNLTRDSENILYAKVNSRFPSTTSVKLIYKSNNFKNKLPKHITSSLLTIPFQRNLQQLRNVNSTSNIKISSNEKLKILNIPSQFYDEDTDGSEYAFYDLSKADLTEEDRSMIECIAMAEEDDTNSFINLESKQPIEDMIELYGISSNDGFD